MAAFYFTSLGDSYAARTDRPQNVGVIGVALFERKRPEPPLEEPAPSAGSWLKRERSSADRQAPAENATTQARVLPAPSAPLGTGHGRREESRVTWVDFERATAAPAETITIYYDSYRNLVARGILQPTYGRRDPSPFPNATFAPDPWR